MDTSINDVSKVFFSLIIFTFFENEKMQETVRAINTFNLMTI